MDWRFYRFFEQMWRHARAGFDWWIEELWAMIPARLKPTPTQPKARFDLHIGSRIYRLERASIDSDGESISGSEFSILEEAIGAFLTEGEADSPLHVWLPQSQVFLTEVRLPESATPTLRQAINFALVDSAPIDRNLLVYDISKRPVAKNERISVDIAMARQAEVQTLAEQLNLAGIAFPVIGYKVDDAAFVFLRPWRLAQINPERRKQRRLFLFCIACLLAISPLVQVGAALLSWRANRQSSEIMAVLAPSLNLNQRAQRLVQIQNRVVEMQRVPQPVALIEAFAERLPPRDWVAELGVTQGAIEMYTHSQNGVATLAALRPIRDLSGMTLSKNQTSSEGVLNARWEPISPSGTP